MDRALGVFIITYIGILLYSEEKQQDFFGCLARFLGCPGLREADNPEI